MKNCREMLKSWSHVEQVKFAVWCAKRVVDLKLYSVINDIINTIDTWILDQSEENRKACEIAVDNAYNKSFNTYIVGTDNIVSQAARAVYNPVYSSYYATNAAEGLHGSGDFLLEEYISEKLSNILEESV